MLYFPCALIRHFDGQEMKSTYACETQTSLWRELHLPSGAPLELSTATDLARECRQRHLDCSI